jgi:hypothetical protein
MAIRDREIRRSPQRRTPAPKRKAKPAQRARPVSPIRQQMARPIAPVQQQRTRPIVQQAPVQQQVVQPIAPLPQAPALQQRAVVPTNQSLPRPVNPAIQQAISMPAETDAFAQHPIPSVNGAFRENGMQNPNVVKPTTISPRQKDTQRKMDILNNPPQAVQAPLVSPAGGEGIPAVQQDIAPVQQAAPRPLPQATPYQEPLTPDISSTTPIAPTDEPVIDQPQQDIAPVGQVESVPQVGATDPVAPVQDVAPVGQVESQSNVVPDPIVDPVTPTPEVGATDPIPPVPQVETPALSVPKPIPSPTSATPVSSNGGSIGLPEAPIYTPQVDTSVPSIAPSVDPLTQAVSNDITPETPKVTPQLGSGLLGGGASPAPSVGNVMTPQISSVLPPPPTQITTPPPAGGGITPPTVLPPPPVGGGVTPSVPNDISRPTIQTSSPTVNQQWQDNSQVAGTGSAQNPYSSIYGGMQDPLAFLKSQGILIDDEYSRYFQGYDPAREQAAYQQYGLGQQAQMMGARAGMMGLTQQQGAGGFAGVGFGGAPARGIRSQFGLGQQQAALGLRGDIYGMRREQEESWWDTLARVEESRGEPFDYNISLTHDTSVNDTIGGTPISEGGLGFEGGGWGSNPWTVDPDDVEDYTGYTGTIGTVTFNP